MNANSIEIERKFLVDKHAFFEQDLSTFEHKTIVQWYWELPNLPPVYSKVLSVLSDTISHHDFQALRLGPEVFELRIRQSDSDFFATFKSRSSVRGGGVAEYEYTLPASLAHALLENTDVIIGKTRYLVPLNGLTLEVDIFDNGQALAEVEVPTLNHPLPPLPTWVGQEVTGNPQYLNRNMARRRLP